jgi:serine/threonine-protein kinase
MTTCPACQHNVPEDARFCPECGASVSLDVSRTAMFEDEGRSAPRSSSAPSQHGRFEPGHRLGERYRIVGLLGQGGMGDVYRADDLELGQSVALKFLPGRLANDAVELDRFRREVRVARGVAHPNVCRTYDIASEDDQVFLVMEYVDGEDLASVLRRMGRPSQDKAVEIARQLCLGLGAAHEAGVLHRDLKPANIMIDGRGRVRITDFGLAGLAEELADNRSIAGTPAYMAPEQLSDGKVSTASEVYSLGLILHEVFTGQRVFDTHNVQELKRLHSESRITSPSSIVEGLDPVVERVLMRCLDSDPSRRPQSAYGVAGRRDAPDRDPGHARYGRPLPDRGRTPGQVPRSPRQVGGGALGPRRPDLRGPRRDGPAPI